MRRVRLARRGLARDDRWADLLHRLLRPRRARDARGGGAIMTSVFYPDPTVAATIAVQGQPAFTGVAQGTSAQALPIPIMWGTRRITPNLIWSAWGSYIYPKNDVHINGPSIGGIGFDGPDKPWIGHISQQNAGSGNFSDYGKSDITNSDSRWWVPTIFALCEGPIIPTPVRMWNGGGATSIAWFDATSTGKGSPDTHPVSLFYEVHPGTQGQSAWQFWAATSLEGFLVASIYPDQDLAYTQLAYIATPLADWTHSITPPSQSFEIIRNPDPTYSAGDSYGGAGLDVSPAYFIPDLLTSAQYGMGLSSSDIDAASLAQYKAYTFAQGLYFSPLLDSQTAGTDIIDRWAQLSNSWVFWSGTAIVFVPLGDEALTGNGQTYTPDNTPAYDLSNDDFLDSGPLQVTRADPIDCNNRVRLEFPDRRVGVDYAQNVIEWKDTTLINLYGLRDASDVSASDICDSAVAAIVVELLGKRMAYVRNSYSFSVSYRFLRLLPGTIITLTDPNIGLDHLPVRVVSVSEDDDGALAITTEEYPGSIGLSRPQPVAVWSPTTGAGAGTGTASAPVGGGTGVPISTSGGGTTLTSGTPSVLVLWIAGDVITLPAAPIAGVELAFTHDLRRVPQPSEPLPEANPVTFTRPSGATYTIEDCQDRTLAPAASVTGRTTGATYRFVYDGAGVLRCTS
jgi:Putative phage tail protein